MIIKNQEMSGNKGGFMPKNPLMVYIRDHLAKNETKKKPGPVITISREYGCLGWEVATGLVDKINKKFGFSEEVSWKAVHREIINKAAMELEIPEHLVEKISRHQLKGILNEMIHTLPYVPDDIKVKKTIAKIVYGLGQHGRYVILGRGGVVVTGSIEDSIHIFLYAPVEWKGRIMQGQCYALHQYRGS
jgi:hypothetical protein